MTRRWEDLDEDERLVARTVFAALDGARGLRDRDETEATDVPGRVSISRIWALLAAGKPLPASVAGACSTDDLAAILERVSVAALPVSAAAATDGPRVTTRTGDGARLTLSPSRAEPSQVYLTIDLTDRESRPGRLMVLSATGAMVDLSLPDPIDGAIQVLLDRAAPAVAALGDPDSRIYLV